jgi:predicted metal-dependent hydrolase
MDQIKIGTVTAKVEKKPIKSIHIYIKPPEGTVLVTAPAFVSDREIQAFVQSKEHWILEHVEQIKKQSALTQIRYEDGDEIPIWGERYRLVLQSGVSSGSSSSSSSRRFSLALFPEPSARNYFEGEEVAGEAEVAAGEAETAVGAGETAVGEAVLTIPEGATAEQKEKFFLRWYRQQTMARLNVLVPEWMAYTGLTCAGWNVRQYRARWGCCNTRTKELTFHAQLSRYPQRCLEYVILHELCHTVIPNHGKEFHVLESKYMPEWKQIRKELNGQI